MRTRRRVTMLVVGLAIPATLLSACTFPGGPMSTPSTPPPTQGTTPPPGPGGTVAPGGSVDPARWSAILEDLAGRGVPTDDVQLVSAEAVTWNNGALGCPKPGQSYTQALVNGMKVIVTAGGKQYDYRFGTGDRPRLCEGIR